MESDSRDLTQEHTNSDDSEVNVVILAGGSSERMRNGLPKQLYDLGNGETTLDLVLQSYECIREVVGITLVYHKDYKDLFEKICHKYGKIVRLVTGGMTRQESTYRGIDATESEYVLIHDSARPLVCERAVLECIGKLREGSKAVNTVFQPPATMVVLRGRKMVGTMDGSMIALGQCPQGFRRESLLEAHRITAKENQVFSDDCSVMLHAYPDIEIPVVYGEHAGFKLTYVEDIEVLKLFLYLKRNSKSQK